MSEEEHCLSGAGAAIRVSEVIAAADEAGGGGAAVMT